MSVEDPGVNCWFAVEFQGVIKGAFRECTGLGSESQIVEYRGCDENDRNFYRKVPGKMKWNDVTLKRGITDATDMWEWRQQVEEGKIDEARRDGSIVMFRANGDELARWNFFKAWPTKIVGPATNAGANEPAIEELTITTEGYKRVAPSA